MYVNYPASQFESLSLTTDPHPEEIEKEKEKEKELIELPTLTRTSLSSSNGDGGIYLVQRGNSLASQKSEELQKTLLAHRHERQLVILQDFPDPDALSCAWSYQLIAQQYDIKCDIVYAGTLSHQENIALVKLTNLPAQRWTMQTLKNKDLSSYQGFVLIDNQGTTSQLLPAIQQAGIPLIVLVDHHSLQGELKSEFVDVRPYVRATATIFTQYLQAGLLTLDNSISQHVKCATALMHGLRSDTNRLMQAQEEDFMAAGYLSRFYDAQLLNAILQANRSKRVMDVIERSLKNRIVQNNFSIAGVGYLRYDDRDAIPQAADFLVTEENVHTAVVYGIVHDEDDELEVVIGSLRTTKLTLDPDEFIKEAFGQDSTGRFFGGGRTGAGGFEIPMGFLSGGNENSAYAKIKWEVFDAQIKQKLLRLVNPRDNPI
ncbi:MULTISPECIES: DHH family phosphoesterase [Dolichospermum]|jgi:nanoRNase/pAp phosphatase (c-di-AMP/oligoRNAs hydrolase)|uniref:Bifunctional oligoribonuclease/PAP phosphatase NrnA n=1 Tax=Dolichospermum flos-aquae CCAP 1403/13F TaxID=315271 RepID=A0A6H2C1N7_DOLFA|nr:MULTISPECIES: bifunctional oligoribonuclease/PAP phosphatase NrnA [Dolichospermum]MBS9388531.1 bifunctional oligoribonuclease/PAP phosphatase NrnA [Dolichospermum sp. WA123]OBQ41152.1 MAG: exopolyphosphatase-like protein [Anabaena sp. MDT14b]MDB9439448.1 bifunctional oligoribonuclease/PAP phosphatase NrnA [Dolichospermum lemmermannii CS-548]MDB9449375.1 bifunctional oligoribonuclease/PAP phosphatase NrnA [Dolichospermum circinale CS-547]QJB45078.1 bifunctional oligoribonuclease/PAP phosphat